MDHGLIIIGQGNTMTQVEAIVLIPIVAIPIALTFMGLWMKNLPITIAAGVFWIGLSFMPILGTRFPLDPTAGDFWIVRAVSLMMGISMVIYGPATAIFTRNEEIRKRKQNRPKRKTEEEEYREELMRL